MRNKITTLFIPLVLILLFSACNYCGDFWGAYDLGNKLTLLDGDKTEHRVIVYCMGKSGGCCTGGMYVIPSVGNQYYMYVDKAKSNDNWVIARTIPIMENIEYAISNKKEAIDKTIPTKESYWIISKDFSIENLNCDEVNCDSIVQSHVIGPLDIERFNGKLSELKIDLEF